MKKIIITVLFAALALSLCACDKVNTTDILKTKENISSGFTSSASGDTSNTESQDENSKNTSSNIETSSMEISSEAAKTSSKESTDSRPVSSESEKSSEEDVIPVEIESEPTGYETEVTGIWKANRILDPSNKEISGEELYGSSYRTYGGSIEFNSDGTFALRMGVSSEDTTSTGTFIYEGKDEIILHYYDDSSTVCRKESIDGKESIVMPFELFGDTFTVYFEM